jgi:PAS domain S-box-containing protein
MADKRPDILVIDDVPTNLLILETALAENFDLRTANSGEMGIALALESPPDLILLDVMMPVMDGFETCRRLKAEPKLKDVPVIFITASSEFESEMMGLALGGADYITKPINVKTAEQRINNLLERESLRRKVEAQRDQLTATLAQLQESEERFRQAFVHAPSGVAVLSIDGRVKEANPALCRLFGYDGPEIKGVTIKDFFLDSPSNKDDFPLNHLDRNGSFSVSEEVVGLHRNGNYIPINRTLSLVRDTNNDPVSFVVQIEDISERKEVQLKELATGILTAQERERARLSHELHDEVGQSLTALRITLKRAQQHSTDQIKIETCLNDSQQMLEHLMEEVRSIAYRLRPSELDQLGLVAALRSHLDKAIRPLGQKVSLTENIGDARLPVSLELCCFRVIQEALTNALRHSKATHLNVSLQQNSSQLILAVKDNGIGFDLCGYYSSHENSSSLGLIGMRERVAANGGRLQIRSVPGEGTEVIAKFDFT